MRLQNQLILQQKKGKETDIAHSGTTAFANLRKGVDLHMKRSHSVIFKKDVTEKKHVSFFTNSLHRLSREQSSTVSKTSPTIQSESRSTVQPSAQPKVRQAVRTAVWTARPAVRPAVGTAVGTKKMKTES